MRLFVPRAGWLPASKRLGSPRLLWAGVGGGDDAHEFGAPAVAVSIPGRLHPSPCGCVCPRCVSQCRAVYLEASQHTGVPWGLESLGVRGVSVVSLQVLRRALLILPEWLRRCHCGFACPVCVGVFGMLACSVYCNSLSVGALLGMGGVAVVCQWVNVCAQMAK